MAEVGRGKQNSEKQSKGWKLEEKEMRRRNDSRELKKLRRRGWRSLNSSMTLSGTGTQVAPGESSGHKRWVWKGGNPETPWSSRHVLAWVSSQCSRLLLLGSLGRSPQRNWWGVRSQKIEKITWRAVSTKMKTLTELFQWQKRTRPLRWWALAGSLGVLFSLCLRIFSFW